MTVCAFGHDRRQKRSLARLVLADQLVVDLGMAIQAFRTLSGNMNFVVMGDEIQGERFLPAFKETWQVVAPLAVSAGDQRVLHRHIGMTGLAVDLTFQNRLMIHLDRLGREFRRLEFGAFVRT